MTGKKQNLFLFFLKQLLHNDQIHSTFTLSFLLDFEIQDICDLFPQIVLFSLLFSRIFCFYFSI